MCLIVKQMCYSAALVGFLAVALVEALYVVVDAGAVRGGYLVEGLELVKVGVGDGFCVCGGVRTPTASAFPFLLNVAYVL